MANETFSISFNDVDSVDVCLQESFKKFLKSRREYLKINKLNNKRLKSSPRKALVDYNNNNSHLRDLFLKQAYSYLGVPYAKRYWTEIDEEYNSPYFLDCCGLVRRVMRDLQSEFGFRLGPWNQGYMFDLLPIEHDNINDVKPGDLVFVEGIFFNEKKKPQKHNIVHVEILIGEGEKSLGARWNKGKVRVFDSYKFVSENYEIKRFIFKSIDTWLQGICRSFCKEHNWHYADHFYDPGKYSIFSSVEQNEEEEQQQADAEEFDSTEIDLSSISYD